MTDECDVIDVLKRMDEKEQFELYQMNAQHHMAIASLDEAFALWKKEQFYRRRRYIQQYGLANALESGYHVPFWQWWIGKLVSENIGK